MNPEQSRLISLAVGALARGSDTDFRRSLSAIRDLNEPDPAGYTLLHSVASTGISRIRREEELTRIRVLLEAGCDPNIPDRNLVTPVCRVAQGRDLAFMQLLIEFGANPCLKDQRGESAFVWATRGPLTNHDILEAMLGAAKRFSPDALPNSDWLEEKARQMANYATPDVQAKVVRLVRKYYPDFLPEFSQRRT